MGYPLQVEYDYVEQRSRLTTFFRGLLIIPVLIVGYLYVLAPGVVTLIAWFALLFTGRWPEGLWNFSTNAQRFIVRLNGYYLLMTDTYPPFDLGEHPEYPVRATFAPPLEKYNRLTVFFRGLYILPAEIIGYAVQIVGMLTAIVSWLAIVFTGKQPQGLNNTMRFCLTYNARVYSLIFLTTESYPPFGDSEAATTPQSLT